MVLGVPIKLIIFKQVYLSHRRSFNICGGLSTFRSLWELLSGFVSTNTTQILQARKQMEYDNNKY